MSSVLGRPARGTGEGGGHHDGGGLRGPAHGAGDVVVVVTSDGLILGTVDVTIIPRGRNAVKLRRPCETQTVGAAAFLVVLFTPSNTCTTAQRKEFLSCFGNLRSQQSLVKN